MFGGDGGEGVGSTGEGEWVGGGDLVGDKCLGTELKGLVGKGGGGGCVWEVELKGLVAPASYLGSGL